MYDMNWLLPLAFQFNSVHVNFLKKFIKNSISCRIFADSDSAITEVIAYSTYAVIKTYNKHTIVK